MRLRVALVGTVVGAVSVAVAVGALAGQAVRAPIRNADDRTGAPNFRLPDASGQRTALADFRGKAVVLNLWATECAGCKAELPHFIQLDEQYRSRGVAVVGVSLDVAYSGLKSQADGWAKVNPFVEVKQMKYPILLDDGSVEKSFRVTALPVTYIIDRAGRIAATYTGVVDAGDLEANVKRVLVER